MWLLNSSGASDGIKCKELGIILKFKSGRLNMLKILYWYFKIDNILHNSIVMLCNDACSIIFFI